MINVSGLPLPERAGRIKVNFLILCDGDCSKFKVLATTATDKACAIARLRQVIERGLALGPLALAEASAQLTARRRCPR